MNNSQDLPGLGWRKSGSVFSWILAILAGLALSINFASAQEEAEDAEAEDEEALELRETRVTGSRLGRPASELSGNLIVLDREAIRATGELTLARVLRQLPQNANPTNETFGSRLNGAENRTGAATVNLRGLGSESTLILVDGRRIGYSGILGGVTDISTIPLSMVDRIEILLDGASAVYGSDAVGGVVNIITRKDYAGIEVDLNYARPHKSGFDETRANVTAGWAWDGGQVRLGYEYFRDSGLDSSQRDSVILSNRSTLLTTNQKNTAPGPQIRVYTNFFDDACDSDAPIFARQRAIVYDLDGRIITRAEYAGLNAETQAMARCINDFTLPAGFQYTDSLSGIDLFGEPHWGEEAEVGFHLRPEQNYDTVNVGVEQDITEAIRLSANVRYGRKDSYSNVGLNQVSATLHANSPFNPFGTQVSLSGLSTDTPPRTFESERDELFVRLGGKGEFGGWTVEAEYSLSKQEADTTQFNVRDPAYGLGVNSDGVSEARIGFVRGIDQDACEQERIARGGTRITYSSFFGGQCTIWGAPPDPINPFTSIAQYIIPDVDAGSTNEQTQFEALARGNLFNAPGGPVAVVMGYDYRQDVLDSFSEITCCYFLSTGGSTFSGAGAPVSGVFNTKISRDNNAAFIEGLVPLVGSDNAMAGVQRLGLTFSGRYDSYSNVEVDYRATAVNDGGTLEAADPGSEFTWSTGLVYRPSDSMLFRGNVSTSFVAPQLNQLLSRVELIEGPASFLWYYVEGGGGAIAQLRDNVVENRGGNDELVPETADTLSLVGEFSPPFLPGVFLKVGWSDTEFKDRIIFLSTPIVDLNNLPSTVTYVPEEDLYIKDNRWINAAAINRSGMDYELRYEWQTGMNDFAIVVRRGYTNKFEVQRDASSDTVHDIVGSRDDTGPEDTVLPPIPKHQTSAQFTWTRGGLFFSFDVQGSDETRIHNFSTRTYITEPATNYDMVIGYEFGQDTFFDAPAWMNGFDVTLTINNLTNAFAKTSLLNPETGERTHYLVNPVYEWTQGRSYRLAIHKSF